MPGNDTRMRIKTAFLVGMAVLLAGCATVPARRGYPQYIDIREFAGKYHVRYDIDLFLETVKFEGDSTLIKGLFESPLVYYNGTIYDLKDRIVFKEGNVYIPSALKDLLERRFVPARPALPFEINTVILDAGHGGRDPGARYAGIEEKSLTLKIVNLLKRELEKYGIRVLLTRDDDRYVSLKKRVKKAHDSSADFFVSIHINASRNRSLNGFEVYYLSERFMNDHTKEIVLKENDSFNNDLSDNTSQILKDMLSKENITRSLELAHAIYRSAGRFGLKTRCIRGAPFYVLKYNNLPSLLVEVGYLSNSYERAQLLKGRFISELVEVITLGIISQKKRYAYLH